LRATCDEARFHRVQPVAGENRDNAAKTAAAGCGVKESQLQTISYGKEKTRLPRKQ